MASDCSLPVRASVMMICSPALRNACSRIRVCSVSYSYSSVSNISGSGLKVTVVPV